jgi:hypothetical protein
MLLSKISRVAQDHEEDEQLKDLIKIWVMSGGAVTSSQSRTCPDPLREEVHVKTHKCRPPAGNLVLLMI